MVALQIRDVPDEVRDVLSREAEERGQSLQAYLLALVKAQAARKRNSELIRNLRATGGGSRMSLEEINELKEQSRAEWDRGLSGVDAEER
jgi:antitoxin FitA